MHGNAATATFSVTAATVSEPVAATLTATYDGVVQRAKVVAARENAVTLAGLSVTPDPIGGGTPTSGRLTLSAPAPFGGAVMAIDAKRRNIVTVPPTVMVPEGATSAVFTISTEVVHGQKERSPMRREGMAASLANTMTASCGGREARWHAATLLSAGQGRSYREV